MFKFRDIRQKDIHDKDTYRGQSGFTIVELMIVVAIAGLILVLVLVAAPALQRNGRDIGRRTDSTALVGAMAQYLSNNGSLPTTTGHMDVIDGQLNLGHYTDGSSATISATALAKGEIGISSLDDIALGDFGPDIDSLQVITGGKCKDAGVLNDLTKWTAVSSSDEVKYLKNDAADVLGTSSHRQYVIMFRLEGEDKKFVCLDA